MPYYENRNGERLWYGETGSGPPVVLLHGWCMSSAVWKFQAAAFSDSFRVLMLDLRGHGHSSAVTEDINFTAFASDVADFFEQSGISGAVLVGWSMGAEVALQAYGKVSDRLNGLVLVSPTPCFTAGADFPHGLSQLEADGMRLKVQRNMQRAMKGFCNRLFAESELEPGISAGQLAELLDAVQYPSSSVALDALESLVRADMRHLLPEIACDTLIVNGGNDRICLPSAAEYIKTRITGAAQMFIPEAGHAPFLTHRSRFNTEVARFVRSCCV